MIFEIFVSFVFWVAALFVDSEATYQYYLADKRGFYKKELNRGFVKLIRRSDRSRRAFWLSFDRNMHLGALMWYLISYLVAFLLVRDDVAAFGGGFLIMGMIHLIAAFGNLSGIVNMWFREK